MRFWNCSSSFITNFQNLLGYSYPFIIPDKPYNYHAKFWKGNPADILTGIELHSTINLGEFSGLWNIECFHLGARYAFPSTLSLLSLLPLNKHFQLHMCPTSSLCGYFSSSLFFLLSSPLPFLSPFLLFLSLSHLNCEWMFFPTNFSKLVTYLKNNYWVCESCQFYSK